MTEKLFVGFTFRDDGNLSRKIDSFRRRFDPKYQSHAFPHMSMLAPFEVMPIDLQNLKEELKEEIDTFFFGHENALKLGFKGVDILQSKKYNLLYLNPHYDATLEHCMELVLDICKSFIPRNIKYKPNPRQFLPLGKFQSRESLENVIDVIKDEFSVNSEITIEGISLFRKKQGIWSVESNLISFEKVLVPFLDL